MHETVWRPTKGFPLLTEDVAAPLIDDLRCIPTLQLDDKIDSLIEMTDIFAKFFKEQDKKWWANAIDELKTVNGSKCTECKRLRKIMFMTKASKHHTDTEKKEKAAANKRAYAELNEHIRDNSDTHSIDKSLCWPISEFEKDQSAGSGVLNDAPPNDIKEAPSASTLNMASQSDSDSDDEKKWTVIPDPHKETFAVGRKRKKPLPDLEVGHFAVVLAKYVDIESGDEDDNTTNTIKKDEVWFGEVTDIDTRLTGNEVKLHWHWNEAGDKKKRLYPGYWKVDDNGVNRQVFSNRNTHKLNPYEERITSKSLIYWCTRDALFRRQQARCTYVVKETAHKHIKTRLAL
jgi:hypothetical protein